MATIHTAGELSRYRLPELGTDWLHGLQDKYVILSLKHSTPEIPQFWMSGNRGYTEYLVQCGTYTGAQVRGQLWYYNDGVNTVAIPCTATAFRLLGYKLVIDFTAIGSFLNREVTQP